MSSDIDGGYAWVILVCCFFSQFVHGGSCTIYGQFFLELSTTFHESAGSLMTVVAVQSFTLYGASLLAGVLCSRFAVRTVGAAGVLLCTAGYVISAFSQHLIWIIFGYGFIVGLGLALHYMAAMTIVQMYFDQKRSLAAGLSGSGIGFGVMAYAPSVRFFIDSFGWRGAMLMLGATYLQCMVFVALMRQPAGSTQHSPPRVKSVHGSSLSLTITTDYSERKENMDISNQEKPSTHDDMDTKHQDKCKTNEYVDTKEPKDHNRLHRILTILDIKLYFNIYVLLFFFASCAMSVCSGVPYNFLPVKCVEDGLSKSDAAMIISFMGLADVIGRWVFGAIGLRVNLTALYALTCGMIGGAVMMLAWTHSFEAIAAAAVLFTFSQGGVFTVGVQSLIQYVGVANFSRVFGFIMMGKAVGYGSAGPFGAYLSEEFGSGSMVFFVVSFFALAASLITCIILSLGKCKVTAAMRLT